MSSVAQSQRRPGKRTFTSPRPQYEVPDTQENRDHAAEAADIEQALLGYGVDVEMVAPTRDHTGVVRLNFDAVAWILDMLDHSYHGEPPVLD